MNHLHRRQWLSWLSAAALGSTLPVAARAQGTSPAEAARPSAWRAGLRSLSLSYHGNPLELSLWYPTLANESVQSFGPYTPSVALGGAVATPAGRARWPVVLISHGTGGTALNHHLQAEALARAGMVAVSFAHPGDNHQDRSLVADARYLFERPRQISQVLDGVLGDADWKDRLDPERVGALGHSAGGYAVAALAGAVPDLGRLVQHCQQVQDDPSCMLRDPRKFVMPSDKRPLVLPASVLAQGELREPRLRAALLTAPFASAVVPGSLGRSTAAIRLLGAEHDEVLPARYHYERLRADLPAGSAPDAARLVAGAGHMSFIAPVLPAWAARMGEVAQDPSGFDRVAFHQALSAETVRFFQQHLQG